MNAQDLDLNLLKALDAILAEGSVSGAARRLGLSQPATSAALSRLRRVLGDPILIRHGNTMVPSSLAEELRPRISGLLDQVIETMQPPKTFQVETSLRRYRIMADEYSTLVLLTPLAGRLRTKGQGITLEVQGFDGRFEERLAVRDCDLVLAHHELLCTSRQAFPLLTDRLVAVVRSDHPRISGPTSLDAFLAERHVLAASGASSRVVAEIGGYLNKSWRPAVLLPQFLALPAMIAATDMVGLLPRFIAATFGAAWHLRVFDPPLEFGRFDIGCVAHPRSAGDQAISWLQREIREIADTMAKRCGHLFGD